MRAHQPGSQPIDIPEAIPNPAVPQPDPAPSQTPKEPVKAPAPQNAMGWRRPADGFSWNGKTYPSLSQVAFAMTPPSERRP
jgi:hypothetical protein